jgi:hypothetical protein
MNANTDAKLCPRSLPIQMNASTRKLTSSIDLAVVPILTQSFISLDLFHTALAITFATLPSIL